MTSAGDLDRNTFSPTSDRIEDVIVAALKALGGIGHLSEIGSQMAKMGHPHPQDSLRARLQENSSGALWPKAQKPRNARDLFYSLAGVEKETVIWGLRGFSVGAPGEYPVSGLNRAYSRLLRREETPLGKNDPRGIAYRGRAVRALQVGFGLPYPDRLLPNGQIEHIGEGRGRVQSLTAGNRGMIQALREGTDIPVFQAIGKRGRRRYASLGQYKVVKYERRDIRLNKNDFDTDAFVFTLEPSTVVRRT